jgi:hypothetical protein
MEVQLRNNEKKTLNTFNRDKNRVTVRWEFNFSSPSTYSVYSLLAAVQRCFVFSKKMGKLK